MKSFVSVLSLFVASIAFAQHDPVGIFRYHNDIGSPKLKGSVEFDASSQTYTMKGGGYNIWFGRDEFQYAFDSIQGNFILTADVEFVGPGVDPHRKIGWMIRSSTEPESLHASAVLHGDGLIVLQWRPLKGSYMRDPEDQISYSKKKAVTIRLERSGKKLIMHVANWGEPLQLVGVHEMPEMPDKVLAGLFVCSHNESVVEQARFWNVRIEKTVPDTHNAYRQGFLGSRLEIMNVFDGKRKVIHAAPGRFEAPNWMPDGKHLLINQGGSMYKIPVSGGEPEKINTAFADRNNNDHGISFDGKMLAISHHRDGLPGGGSTIYVLPVTGGTPKLITEKTPSYWHGWSPNGKEVVFVGQRGEQGFNIYKTNLNGGPEIALTDNKSNEHADGPEYSPDGKFIYYNANPTGTMQLWRMKPDGTGKEQLTFDEYNDWFPHTSPDGKWIAFISFPRDIDPDDHPFYKRVMLRLMPVSGGAPRVIAHLYGGQGTINVPSWSPDSKQIAFVSNSGQ